MPQATTTTRSTSERSSPISERSTTPLGVDAAEEGRAESGWLLVDLLEHVVLVAAKLDGLGVPIHLEGLALDGLAGSGEHPDRRVGYLDDLTVLDDEKLVRLPEQGLHGAGQEVLPLPQTDDQRALVAGGDDLPGSSALTAATAKEPSSRWRTPASAARNVSPASTLSASRCAITSVSVSERKTTPRPSSSSLSSEKFSMMPLCTTATPPSPPRWGCAFSSLGRPCVAQRVCPTPVRTRERSPLRPARAASGSRAARPPYLLYPAFPLKGQPRRIVTPILQVPETFHEHLDTPLSTGVTHYAAHGLTSLFFRGWDQGGQKGRQSLLPYLRARTMLCPRRHRRDLSPP